MGVQKWRAWPKQSMGMAQRTPIDSDPRTAAPRMALQRIGTEQLCEGLYVCLDLPWLQHPFLHNRFKITSARQLAVLRGLGLEGVEYDPERSDAQPLPPSSSEVQPPSGREDDAATRALWEEKQRRIRRLRERRMSLNRCENEYRQSVTSMKEVMRNLFSRPEDAMQAAEGLLGGMVESLTADTDVALHLVNIKNESESAYFHVINVAVLAMMLGKALGLERATLYVLGQGALLHDIGKARVPARVLHKGAARNRAEQRFYEMHPDYGLELAEKIRSLHPAVLRIIAQHHEMLDGSGYPKGLGGRDIDRLARIVAIVNAYDNYCNEAAAGQRGTPFEAVSRMFARERRRYDDAMLQAFINLLGVYPPGTVVQLSGGGLGMVVSVNQDDLLRPAVLLYDPEVPNDEAVILDLREERDLKVEKAVRPDALDADALEYLSPASHVNYFMGAAPRRP
jgi:putative nucleotidyltransferase with HDIG domain